MHHGLVHGLRDRGVDLVTVTEAGRRGLSDEEHLQFATAAGRVVYTGNVGDFARLHNQWVRNGIHHAGIIALVDRRTGLGLQIAALTRLSVTKDSAAMRDQIEFLSAWISG